MYAWRDIFIYIYIDKDDHVFEKDGAQVVVDAASMEMLKGTLSI